MTFEQIISLISGAAQPAIFAGLFIWLFTKDRDDSRTREAWARDYMEKLRVSLENSNEQQRQQTQAMGQIVSSLARIETNQINQRGEWKKGA